MIGDLISEKFLILVSKPQSCATRTLFVSLKEYSTSNSSVLLLFPRLLLLLKNNEHQHKTRHKKTSLLLVTHLTVQFHPETCFLNMINQQRVTPTMKPSVSPPLLSLSTLEAPLNWTDKNRTNLRHPQSVPFEMERYSYCPRNNRVPRTLSTWRCTPIYNKNRNNRKTGKRLTGIDLTTIRSSFCSSGRSVCLCVASASSPLQEWTTRYTRYLSISSFFKFLLFPIFALGLSFQRRHFVAVFWGYHKEQSTKNADDHWSESWVTYLFVNDGDVLLEKYTRFYHSKPLMMILRLLSKTPSLLSAIRSTGRIHRSLLHVNLHRCPNWALIPGGTC